MSRPVVASVPRIGTVRDEAAQDRAAPTALQELRRLDSGPRGLTEAQAEERLARFGENTLPSQQPVPLASRFLRSLRDPFTAVLLCLGLVSALVASWGTAGVIAMLVAVSCLLRSSGEHRADRQMTSICGVLAATATVLRRGAGDATPTAREVPVDQIVPGDVVRLGTGDLVPADLRLLRASGLNLYQAALTGESAPVVKYPVDVPGPAEEGIFEQPHLCFQGSSVASGSGTAVVVATGARTQWAGGNSKHGRRVPSAFDRDVHGIAWLLIRFMLLTPPLVLMANAALRDRGLETLPFAVAVAVALTPEMLPVVVTTCLARGASLLARTHGVIVKRLPALHDLGAVDVLCLDKTGTLTQDRPIVHRALDADGHDAPEVLQWAAVNAWWTLQLADLPAPDALDEAILDAVDTDDAERYEGMATVPFDAIRRLATAVLRVPGRLGTHTLVVKGAVETILERCVLEDGERQRLLTLAADQAADGLRVLALATSERRARIRDYTPADEHGLTFQGFVTFRDALVPTATETLRNLGSRGIAVKILTGDHPGTAARVCRDLGIPLGNGDVLDAGCVDSLTDSELVRRARRTTVFARCTPEHKARITAALRADGHTTGFLGDGVNDLPALHAADVGICPRDAADVVRENADVVMADKDLTAIDHAVAAGRCSNGNIATYLRVTLSSNLGNVIAMLGAGLLLSFLPMLPVQVLVQNLCFDAAQLAYAYDRPPADALLRPTALRPRDFLRYITGFGVLNASADLATFVLLAMAVHSPGTGDGEVLFHSGWFTENLLTQSLVMLLLRLGRRTASGPVGWAAIALAAVGLLLPLSPVGPLLGMTPLPGLYYLLLAGVLALYAAGLALARSCYGQI